MLIPKLRLSKIMDSFFFWERKFGMGIVESISMESNLKKFWRLNFTDATGKKIIAQVDSTDIDLIHSLVNSQLQYYSRGELLTTNKGKWQILKLYEN